MRLLRSFAHAASVRVQWCCSSLALRIISGIPAIALCLAMSAVAPAQAKAATTTGLALTASSGAASTVPAGTVVTLTASVSSGSGKITTGQVNFCDATATYCTDIHLLATAQLTSAGTAVFRFRPGIGSHSYKAVFVGTKTNAASSSSASALTVTGKYPTTTTIAASGIPNNYMLTASVVGVVNNPVVESPTGTVSFLDTNNGNAVLGTASLETSTSWLTFFNSSNPATVTEPNAVAAADFNGDGIVDLAVSASNTGATALTILLGNGDGTFTSTTTSPTVGQYPDGIAVGDFNGDGIPDLAVTSVDQSEVVILLGKGDGTFNAGPTLSTSGTPQWIATADFDGDGNADLAVVNGTAVSIFLGNGDGTFKSSITVPSVGTSPVGLGVGDFNGDGIPDLAIASTALNGPVSIFLGKGDGTFTAGTANPIPGNDIYPLGIAVGDFNGDGILDLAVTNYDAANQNAVAILLGNGDGSFKTPVLYGGVGSNFHDLAVADLNGDGVADLVVAQFWSGPASTLLGNGDGTFQSAEGVMANAPLSTGHLAVADFDGDGAPDLALPNQDPNGTAVILLTQNTRSVSVAVSGVAPTGPGTHLAAASYPGDINYQGSTSITTGLQSQVMDPVISVPTGAYTSVKTITITDATPGAAIYYQASGIVNTNGYVPYTGPIALTVGGSETIAAYASENGYQTSNIVLAYYTLVLPPESTPAISPAAGFYSGPQTVTITDSDPSAQIYYTTNGTVPNAGSNRYSGPITVSSSETVATIAVSNGHSFSLPVCAQYVIGSSPVAMIYSVAGSGQAGYTGDGGPATQAQLDLPYAVVKDASGNLYISDEENHMVRKVATGTGIITVVAGNGYSGYSGDGGQGTNAELIAPGSLALDNAGNLFIADIGTGTVRELNLSSGIISTYAGDPNATGPGEGGPATAANLGYIGAIALDASNNLYISNGNTIQQVNATTGIINTIAGNGSYGYGGDGGAAINAEFAETIGMAFDGSGNLYIADTGNSLIRKITATNGVISSSSIISTVAGTAPQNGAPVTGYSGDGGPATSAKLFFPIAVALDSAGNLYISDTDNNVIREVTAANGIIATVAGNNACSWLGGDGGLATNAAVCYPNGIAVDRGGNLLIADASNRIREVFAAAAPPTAQTATVTFSLPAGNYSSPQSIAISDATPGATIYVTVDGSTPTTGSAGYSLPIDVTGVVTIEAVASAPGYLPSAPVSATYTVSAAAPIITTVAGDGSSGVAGAGGPALSLPLPEPMGVAVDQAGNLYVSEPTSNVVWMISASTQNASIFAGIGDTGDSGDGGAAVNATMRSPEGLAFDSAGNLYIADHGNNLIRKVAADTGIISTVAGGGNPTSGIGDGGLAIYARLQSPSAVAFDGANDLYIADTLNNRIREVSATTGIITTVAGNGNYQTSGDGGAATNAGLRAPDSVAVDKAGDIYIGSSNGTRVREVTAATGDIDTIAGFKDIGGQTGDGGPAISAEINPHGLALDSSGNLYISNLPGEIREINAGTGVISRVAGIGYTGYSGDGGAAAAAEVDMPVQIAFDGAGNLYFADGTNRIRKVTFNAQVTAAPVFSVPSGTYSTSQSVTITDATAGATIYYTTDGSAPSNQSNVYTSAIAVNASETINAIAISADFDPSTVTSASYVLIPPPTLTNLSPAYISAGGAQFTLTVNGSGFTNASTVYWGNSALTTQYVSPAQVTATVPAAAIATGGIVSITAQTPAPGGGTSNTLQFEIDTGGSTTPPSFSPTSVTVNASGTATYSVTLPSSATGVSVQCLNLPAGAACSYSSSAGTLTITTASSTPAGTYVITVIFTETLPGAAAGAIVLLFLFTPFARANRRNKKKAYLLAMVGLLTVMAAITGCGGGGGSSGGTNPSPATHQVTSSGTVTLIVK
jgi:sugar lactone lactonase YvrE